MTHPIAAKIPADLPEADRYVWAEGYLAAQAGLPDLDAVQRDIQEARAYLARAERGLTGTQVDSTGPAPAGPPTQASALRAAAAILEATGTNPTASTQGVASLEMQAFGDGTDSGRLAELATLAALLTGRHLSVTSPSANCPFTQCEISGDYPGASRVRVVALTKAPPTATQLAGLRAVCQPAEEDDL